MHMYCIRYATKAYLSHRKQLTKVNHAYSSWEEILFGVSQGSILGPILFNIFLSGLFLVISDTDNSIHEVISSLQLTEINRKIVSMFLS